MATTGSSSAGVRRRLTLPEGADYVPMFGYDSDGELVVISPSRRGSVAAKDSGMAGSRRQIGGSYPRGGGRTFTREDNTTQIKQSYPRDGQVTRVKQNNRESLMTQDAEVKTNLVAAGKSLIQTDPPPRNKRLQKTSSVTRAAEAFEVVNDGEDIPVEDDDLREALPLLPPPLTLTRDNLTGLAMNSVASSSSGPSAPPLTESDIMNAETARGDRRGSDYADVTEGDRRVVGGPIGAEERSMHLPMRRFPLNNDLLWSSENNEKATRRPCESSQGDSRRSCEDSGASLKSSGGKEGASLKSSGGKEGASLKSSENDEGDSRRSSRNAEVSPLAPFEMVKAQQLKQTHASSAAEVADANINKERPIKTPLEHHRDRRLKKALEGLRRSLALPPNLGPTRRSGAEVSPAQAIEPSAGGMIERGSKESSVMSEEWIDGRIEEQRPDGMEEVLVDSDAAGHQYVGGQERANSRVAFETELALEEAVLRKLSPLKRAEVDMEAQKGKPKPSVRELMAEIQRARDMTRHLERRRVSESVSAAGQPVHVAKVEADWTALRSHLEPPSALPCRKCGASPSAAQAISSSLPGANKADEKPCSPMVDERPKGEVLPAYVWPLPIWMPPVSREDTKLAREESPRWTVRPSLPIAVMPNTVAYKTRPVMGLVGSKDVDISPRKPTEDRSTGDYRVTVSTVETQTPPIEPSGGDRPSSTSRERSPRAPAREMEPNQEGYHEVLRDRLWRGVAEGSGSSSKHSRENVVLVDGKIVSYNRETDPPPGHGRDIPPIHPSRPVQNAQPRGAEVISGPPVRPRVTTVKGNDHLVYAYRARVASCDYFLAGGFLRVGLGNSREIVWSSPITARIRWEVGDIITVVGVARPAPREIVVRLNNTFILDRTSIAEFPLPDDDMDLIPGSYSPSKAQRSTKDLRGGSFAPARGRLSTISEDVVDGLLSADDETCAAKYTSHASYPSYSAKLTATWSRIVPGEASLTLGNLVAISAINGMENTEIISPSEMMSQYLPMLGVERYGGPGILTTLAARMPFTLHEITKDAKSCEEALKALGDSIALNNQLYYADTPPAVDSKDFVAWALGSAVLQHKYMAQFTQHPQQATKCTTLGGLKTAEGVVHHTVLTGGWRNEIGRFEVTGFDKNDNKGNSLPLKTGWMKELNTLIWGDQIRHQRPLLTVDISNYKSMRDELVSSGGRCQKFLDFVAWELKHVERVSRQLLKYPKNVQNMTSNVVLAYIDSLEEIHKATDGASSSEDSD
ncbi:hypothetical protein FOL47_008842 [Perkinsus chesapeaki]|uniref:Uncharacterized protein n=1 Tax=Perkinsus chesapeaki TaxID=330153 RepID=A0A7J6LBQ2_PERCH|nr:hypothetical protein FOL47_008842 [Perkinsus chesapeaki]